MAMKLTLAAPAEQTAPATPEEQELAALPWMIRLTIACLLATGLGWALEHAPGVPHYVPWLFYGLAYATGGFYSIQEAWETLKQRQFDVNFLMIVAAVGAALVGQPREGAILMFLFSLSGTLETYAMGRTYASIRALLDLAPQTATVLRDGGEQRVPVEQVAVGETVLVRPGEQIPTDGIVTQGESAVNEATITGESMPVEKLPGAKVFAGTLNTQGALHLRVSAAIHDSTLARIVATVQEAREQKAKSQDFTDRVIGQYYAYAVVGITLLAIFIPLAFLGWDLRTTFYRAMTLMVVASPCALVISIPAALLSALARAARFGVLFKGGAHLETAARVKVVAFDKTGTLTTGKPGVVAILPVGGGAQIAGMQERDKATRRQGDKEATHPDVAAMAQPLPLAPSPPRPIFEAGAQDELAELNSSQAQLLSLAAAVERYSEHPLARAIVKGAEQRGVPIPDASEFQALTGAGATATVCDQRLRIGRPSMFAPLTPDVALEVDDQQRRGRTVVLLGDEQPWGLIAIADTVRPEAAQAVARLKQIGIARVVLLTGDNRSVAETLGAQLGVDEVRAELLPEQKVDAVRDLQARYGPVAMIGDGVNDAPALATATLGVAMGAAGTDVALESADVLLMGDDLSRLPGALALARKARRVVLQNLVFAFTVMATLMVFATLGAVPLPLGVVGHEGSTLIVVLSGLRLLVYNPDRNLSPRVTKAT